MYIMTVYVLYLCVAFHLTDVPRVYTLSFVDSIGVSQTILMRVSNGHVLSGMYLNEDEISRCLLSCGDLLSETGTQWAHSHNTNV